MKSVFFRWLMVGSLSIMAGPIWADMSPAQALLKQMAQSSRTTNYTGTFTYEHGGVLKTLKIFHGVQDGKEYERLIHLNGPQAEMLRRGNSLECRRAGDVLMRGAIIDDGVGYGRLEDFYTFSIQGSDRVAGRAVTELHVVPKDQMRYGYVFSIDDESSLLLKALLVSADRKKVLERFQYVDIQIGDEIADSELESDNIGVQVADVDLLPCIGDEEQSFKGWQVSWLPKGFVLVGVQDGVEVGSETLVFTDGMGSFTVFVDSGPDFQVPPVTARRGATVAVMSRASRGSKSYVVCVVGEIPVAAANQVVQSVQSLPVQ